MSAQVKKAGRIGAKIVAVFLFLVLLMFNVEVGLYDGEVSGSGILGLTMSVFVPDLLAGGGSNPGEAGDQTGRRFVDPEDGWNHCLCPWVPKNCSPCY